MSNILFKQGKQNIGNKAVAFNADTFKASLLTMATAAGKIALIASSTNATPIVATTSGAHGYSVGDIVVIGGHVTNTALNGTWYVSAVTSTTLTLQTVLDQVNSTGNGVGGATGWIIDITTAAVLSDVSANSNGTDVSLSGVTNTGGVINASAWTWTGLSATKSWAIGVYDSTASNDLIAWIDGTFQVYVVTQAVATNTAIAVQRLPVVLPSAQTLVFSNGQSATLSAQANVGDTSLAVTSLGGTVARQATADAGPTGTGATAAGIPMTPGAGGSLQFTPDSGVNKLFVL
jgi:hypothetical protein